MALGETVQFGFMHMLKLHCGQYNMPLRGAELLGWGVNQRKLGFRVSGGSATMPPGALAMPAIIE